MSGTARLVGHRVEVLADSAIVGPLPTQLVSSSDNVIKCGYEPYTLTQSPAVAQVVPANTQQVITLPTGGTVSHYFPTGSTPTNLNSSTPNILAGNVFNNFVRGFYGKVQALLFLATDKAAPLVPVENYTIIVTLVDNTGTISTKGHTFPLTTPTGSNFPVVFEYSVAIPYSATRTFVQIQLSINNQQSANTLTIQTSSVFNFIQDK